MYRKIFLPFVFCICYIVSFSQEPVDTTNRIADSINIQDHNFSSRKLPGKLKVKNDAGIATFPWVQASVICHARNRKGGLYECRATVTPGGDYLLMFPDGGHYGKPGIKVNDMLSYRSSDKGKTWKGPSIAFDIDYNQHGFIPFIPKNSKRI